METAEAAWVSQTEKRIADLEQDRDEARKKLEEAHREIERLKRLQPALRLGVGGDYTKYTDGLALEVFYLGNGSRVEYLKGYGQWLRHSGR